MRWRALRALGLMALATPLALHCAEATKPAAQPRSPAVADDAGQVPVLSALDSSSPQADSGTEAQTDAALAPEVARPQGLQRLDLGGRPALTHAPAVGGSQMPLVVFLHGMCAIPEWECPVFTGASAGAWLLCPPGPAPCAGGGRMWVGTRKRLTGQVGRFTSALVEQESLSAGRRALVGYSLGAPAALQIALAEPGRWQRLMIVNASVVPSAAQLKRAGVTRLALVAGAHDRTAGKLRQGAQRLARSGVDARFFSLGPVGHFFDRTSAQRMVPSLTWLTADWES